MKGSAICNASLKLAWPEDNLELCETSSSLASGDQNKSKNTRGRGWRLNAKLSFILFLFVLIGHSQRRLIPQVGSA